MDESTVVGKVNSALAGEFELEPSRMVPEARIFDDLGLDSLDIVDMVVVLEKTFGFRIRDQEALQGIRTLGDIHRFILDKAREIQGAGR